jgi:hypothetical protein
MDKIKPYFDFRRIPFDKSDITEQELLDHLKFHKIPFSKDGMILSFTPTIPRGDLKFHEDIIHKIRLRRQRLKK